MIIIMSNEKKMMWKETVVAYCDYLEVLTAVIMKSTISWDATPCSLAVHQRYGERICLHPQGERVSMRDIEMQIEISEQK
jgi:hypothetical protein